MPVVHALSHFAIQYFLKLSQVKNHAGFWVRLAGNGDFQNVIVPVTVRIVAFAENAPVFVRGQIRIVVKVCGREFEFSRYANHSFPTGYSRRFHWTLPRQYFQPEAATTAA